MSMCLGMMFHQGDLPFLRLHLPYLRQGFQHILAASDNITSEAADFMRDCGTTVVQVPFNDNWSESLNAMIDTATNLGYTKMIRLDPDELLFIDHIPLIEMALDMYRVVVLPRHNFWYSRETVDVGAWPDYQARCWRLDGSIRYIGKRHEGITYDASESCTLQGTAICHYGDASTTGYMRKALKYFNYARIDAGLTVVDKLPDTEHPGANVRQFDEPQPIDPKVCGIYAPFER